ncbi:MAG TPA: T9SS type A sorting domain-containing protein, partial [Chitinophagaceae bacterium]|nr:T9SS type A sorting domain-containing protein [Chitinophagaceae bacterium]
NPYDLDSDSDGITDTREAGFTDADWNGRIDGTYNADGWSNVVAAMASLNLPDTDGTAGVNVYDIDSDDDGIPDNIEGQTTPGYLLPSGIDTDGDGIDNVYDDFNGFGGDGIHVYDEDGDGVPDYLDSDTDNDGTPDIVEGNDFNHNNLQDDNITLTGVDTDGDGLDDRFDNDHSSAKGTSSYMGNGGSITGDASPGSITVVQHTPVPGDGGCPTERDWRCLSYVLNCQVISFNANLHNEQVLLDWSTLCAQEADHFIVLRSTDKISFTEIARVPGKKGVNEVNTYQAIDNLNTVSGAVAYYQLKSVLESGREQLSNIISVRRANENSPTVQIFPNPVNDQLQVAVRSAGIQKVQVRIVAANGLTLRSYTERLMPGYNVLTYHETRSLPNGIYYLQLILGEQLVTRKFSILK